MERKELLSITDAESIQNAILQLVMTYPEYPESFEPSYETIKWNGVNQDASIGLFPLPGAVYLKRYIYGGYKAQFYFAIRYRSSPQSANASINSQMLVENIAKWLEKCAINFNDGKTTIESITRTSQVYSPEQDDKNQDNIINMRVIYEYEE